MATLNQINKAIRYFKFETRKLQYANKEMLEKSLVVQTYDPTIAVIDSVILMPFDYRILPKLAISLTNAFNIKLKSYDAETILAAKSIPYVDKKNTLDLALAFSGAESISKIKGVLYKSSLYDEKSGKYILYYNEIDEKDPANHICDVSVGDVVLPAAVKAQDQLLDDNCCISFKKANSVNYICSIAHYRCTFDIYKVFKSFYQYCSIQKDWISKIEERNKNIPILGQNDYNFAGIQM
jgi:hypothetical protein